MCIPVLPTVEEVSELVSDIIKGEWWNDEGMIDLTIATNGEELPNISGGADWTFQTGDNSYTGSCYHYRHWAVTTISREDDNPNEIAENLVDQLAELVFQ